MVRLSRCQKISCTTSFFQSAISRWNRGINEVLASIIRPLYKTMTRIYTRLILKPSSYTYVKFLILLITNIKLPTVMKNRHKSFIRLGFSVWQKHGCCRPPGQAGFHRERAWRFPCPENRAAWRERPSRELGVFP